MEWNGKGSMVLEKLSEGALDLERSRREGRKSSRVKTKQNKIADARCAWGTVSEGPDWTGVLGEEVGARFFRGWLGIPGEEGRTTRETNQNQRILWFN